MMSEVSEVDDDVFRMSEVSITAVDSGLSGLEIIPNPQNMSEWVARCCCSCLGRKKNSDQKKNKKKRAAEPVAVLQMQDFSKRSGVGGDSEVELRSSFHFPREDPQFLDEEMEQDDEELNADVGKSESHLTEYEKFEETLLDVLSHEMIAHIRNNPESYLTAEDENVTALAAARLKLFQVSPELKEELASTNNVRSKASLTRFLAPGSRMDSTLEGPGKPTSEGDSTTNPLHMGNDYNKEEQDDDEAVDEVVTNVRAGRIGETLPNGGFNPSARRLSKRWAGHLSEIASTQGRMSEQVDNHGEVILKVRPKWPDWLIDVVYDVVKTNKYGRRQQRQLKLTKYHLVNIKDNSKVTRLHKYSALKHAYLVRCDAFVLEFFDEQKNPPLFYESLVAGQIVQQISTRVQVRGALDDVSLDALDLHGFHKSMGFSVRATNSMIEIISSESFNRETTMLDFARNLGATAVSICESAGFTVTESTLESDAQAELYLHLTNIEKDSKEFYVKQTVEEIVLNKSGPAGNTTKHFLQKFINDPSNTELIEVRHFVDGMHEYILENNILHLVDVLHGRQEATRASVDMQIDNSLTELNQEDVFLVSHIVFMVVENVVFFPLQDAILSRYYSDESVLENEVLLLRKMRVLSERHQHEWNISSSHQSPAAWSSAIFELAGIERNPTPSMRLQALVYTARSIYSEFKCEILPILKKEKGDSLKDNDAALGADDFLPIFIFVVCRAGLSNPTFNKDMLWQLCHPDQLHGECGYYLTVYESALEYILSQEVPEDKLQLTGIESSSVTNSNSALTQLPENPIRKMTLL